MLVSATPSRRERKAQVRALPAPLRVARVAELLFFPVIGYMLLGLPVPSAARPAEIAATLLLAAEAVVAVAVAVGLGRRRPWARVLGIVLAAWVIIGIALRGGPVVRAAMRSDAMALKLAVALLAWTCVTQLVAGIGCLIARDEGEAPR